ncbi:hypothetical protein X801_03935, partial [Opisthorchis viverrini]
MSTEVALAVSTHSNSGVRRNAIPVRYTPKVTHDRRRPAPSATHISRRPNCPQQSSVLQQKTTHKSSGGDMMMKSKDCHADKSDIESHPRPESIYLLEHTGSLDTNDQKYSVRKGSSIQGAQLDHLIKHLEDRKNNARNKSEIVRQSLSSTLRQTPQNYLLLQSCSEPCYLNNMNETVRKIADHVPLLKIKPYDGRSLQSMKNSDKITMECENEGAQFINSERQSKEVNEMALLTSKQEQQAGEKKTDHSSDFTVHTARAAE